MDADIMLSVWDTDVANLSVIDTLMDLLEEKELDFYDLWMKHNASLVFMEEYTYSSMYQQLKKDGWLSDSWMDGTPMTDETSFVALDDLGFRIHRAYDMSRPRVRVQVWADPIGTFDSIAEFRATLVHRSGSIIRYTPVELNNWFGELVVDGITEYDDLYLVVGSWADRSNSSFGEDEQFFYRYAMEGLEAVYNPEGSADGDVGNGVVIPEMQVCGCASIEPNSMFALLSMLLLYRRRRTHE